MPSLLERILSTPFGELVSWRAFEPDPGDVTERLGKRFAGRDIVVLALGTKQMKLGVVGFAANGEPKVRDVQLLGQKGGNALTEHLKGTVRPDKKGGQTWALILVSTNWVTELLPVAYHGSMRDRARLLRDEPQDVVGKPLPLDSTHAVVTHPTMEYSLLFATQLKAVQNAREAVIAAGLKVARVQNPHVAMLEAYCLAAPDEAQKRSIITADFQGLTVLPIVGREWRQPRYRAVSPGEIAADAAKFLTAVGIVGEPLTLLGQPSLIEGAWSEIARPSEIVVPFEGEEHPEIYCSALL